MKTNIRNIFSLSLVSVLLFAFSSCKEEHYNYTPTNECVSFASPRGSYDLDGNNIEVAIARGVADEELTVDLSMVDTNNVYTLETPSITFAKGATTATAILSYSISDPKVKPATVYAFTLSFDDSVVSPAGSFSFSGSASMPLVWEDYGTITLTDPGWAYATNDYVLQKADYTTNYFRIKNMFGSDDDLSFYIDDDGYSHVLDREVSTFGSTSISGYQIPTSYTYPEYGQVSCWLYPEPEGFPWSDLGDGNKIVLNSKAMLYIHYTLADGHYLSSLYAEPIACTSVD